MKSYMDLMGRRVRDKVTKFEGVVGSVCFDLYGCVQVSITPGVNDKDGKLGDQYWFDWKRIEVIDKVPVMPVPQYEKGPGTEIGCAEKPTRSA